MPRSTSGFGTGEALLVYEMTYYARCTFLRASGGCMVEAISKEAAKIPLHVSP